MGQKSFRTVFITSQTAWRAVKIQTFFGNRINSEDGKTGRRGVKPGLTTLEFVSIGVY
jgi:hypothetical protein